MKTLLAIIILCCGLVEQPAWAQKKNKRNIYHAWVMLEGSNFVERGYLYELKDSSIVISHKLATDPDYYPSYREFQIQEIKTLMLRKKGNVGRGILIGSLTGLVGGIIISSDKKREEVRCPSYNPGPNYTFGSTLYAGLSVLSCSLSNASNEAYNETVTPLIIISGALIGGGIGAGIGSIKTEIHINGKQWNYDKEKLSKYQLRY